MPQEEYVQFFTATILEWKDLLKQDKYKQIILNSLKFLVEQKRVKVYGFVIMINHIHIIWHIQPGHKRENIQRDFLKYTAQQIKSDLEKHHPKVLPSFLVNAKDRQYQIWERNPLSIDIWSREVLWQKLQYMHQNPVRAGVCQWPQEYYWSSALFYQTGTNNFEWLTHVMD
jgi:REP element-mobilizing transposase RayT